VVTVPGSAIGTTTAPPDSYVHDVLFHDSDDELVAGAAPFLREGLAGGDAVVLATGPRTAALLREAVGNDDRLLVLGSPDGRRARPAAAIASFRRLVEACRSEGARRVRTVGEPDPGPTPRDWLEWQRYEAVVNDVLAPLPLWGMCVYDTRRLPGQVLESALRTHPHVVGPRMRCANPAFADPAAYVRTLPAPHDPLQDREPVLAVHDVRDFIALRHAVAATLGRLDGPRDTLDDLLLAIDEMCSNAVRHGAPPVDLRLWASAERAVCTITDRGAGIADPFAGYGPAHGDDLSRGGMGLWLARQLCDHVDVTSGAGGLTVRLTTGLR
jgi:anti-sigma regulatory factor (Ser/Thr protein kinase)